MVEIAFSFHGRLKRLRYFLASLGLGLAFVVGLCVIGVGFAAAVAGHRWSAVALLCVALLPLVVAMLWCSLSLHVRRIRDIGWDPTIVVACWLFGNLADKLVLGHLVPGLAQHLNWQGTYLGVLANFALSLAILFWPSREDDGDAAAPPRQTWTAPPPLSAPRPVAPHVTRATNGQVVFGRRSGFSD